MILSVLNLPASPVVMGILNLRSATTVDMAVARGEQILEEGAAIIDIVTEEGCYEDLDLIIPTIDKLHHRMSIPLSISTSNPDIMSAAVGAGASLVNDTRALTMPGALAMAAGLKVTVCIMHMHNDPVNKHKVNVLDDVVQGVYQYLERRIEACIDAGISKSSIIIDPGFGFGKTLQQNLTLLRSLNKFKFLHCPILVGLSHKSMIGQIIDAPTEQRAFGSVTAAAIAIGNGADIIRAHEVKGTMDAIKVIRAVSSM